MKTYTTNVYRLGYSNLIREWIIVKQIMYLLVQKGIKMNDILDIIEIEEETAFDQWLFEQVTNMPDYINLEEELQGLEGIPEQSTDCLGQEWDSTW